MRLHSTGGPETDLMFEQVSRSLDGIEHNDPEATANFETMFRVTKEFSRRALEVGPEQALTEAADWHENAPIVIGFMMTLANTVLKEDQ